MITIANNFTVRSLLTPRHSLWIGTITSYRSPSMYCRRSHWRV